MKICSYFLLLLLFFFLVVQSQMCVHVLWLQSHTRTNTVAHYLPYQVHQKIIVLVCGYNCTVQIVDRRLSN